MGRKGSRTLQHYDVKLFGKRFPPSPKWKLRTIFHRHDFNPFYNLDGTIESISHPKMHVHFLTPYSSTLKNVKQAFFES
ncbi:CLUMA_CG006730, isoform A [Clunio marinus]|uniref:CLUMA_CG006730, isoform A n=1 Tax=Clunio marinus TaxID=568069 RepID=A0A1J1I072_9DIPT|nr:CLUMA_CG006730, isoform A [Clunio marinus]